MGLAYVDLVIDYGNFTYPLCAMKLRPTNKHNIKRPGWIYFLQIFWIYTMGVYAIRNSDSIARFTLIVLGALGFILLINSLVKRNYFEIRNSELFINHAFFRTRSVKLKEISRVEIEPGPFTRSKIYLKNGQVISYLDTLASEAKVKQLLGEYNIPVE